MRQAGRLAWSGADQPEEAAGERQRWRRKRPRRVVGQRGGLAGAWRGIGKVGGGRRTGRVGPPGRMHIRCRRLVGYLAAAGRDRGT